MTRNTIQKQTKKQGEVLRKPSQILDKHYDEEINEFVYLVSWIQQKQQTEGSAQMPRETWERESKLLGEFPEQVISYNESLEKFDFFRFDEASPPPALKKSQTVVKTINSQPSIQPKRKPNQFQETTLEQLLEPVKQKRNSTQKTQIKTCPSSQILTRSKAIRKQLSQPEMLSYSKPKKIKRVQKPATPENSATDSNNVITILKSDLVSPVQPEYQTQPVIQQAVPEVKQAVEIVQIEKQPALSTMVQQEESFTNNSINFFEASTLLPSSFDYQVKLDQPPVFLQECTAQHSPFNSFRISQTFEDLIPDSQKGLSRLYNPSDESLLRNEMMRNSQNFMQIQRVPDQISAPNMMSTDFLKFNYPHLYIQWLEMENARLRLTASHL